MTRSQRRPWLIRLVAAAALFAVGFGPTLHGVHAAHATTGASIAAPAVAADAQHEAATCPVCAALAQARTAIAPAAPCWAPRASVVVADLVASDDPCAPAFPFSPASPRAPPAHA